MAAKKTAPMKLSDGTKIEEGINIFMYRNGFVETDEDRSRAKRRSRAARRIMSKKFEVVPPKISTHLVVKEDRRNRKVLIQNCTTGEERWVKPSDSVSVDKRTNWFGKPEVMVEFMKVQSNELFEQITAWTNESLKEIDKERTEAIDEATEIYESKHSNLTLEFEAHSELHQKTLEMENWIHNS